MCRYLHFLDERWGLPDVRPSADTFRPVANWPAMSSRDDNEGRSNQNTRGMLYVFKQYVSNNHNASQESSRRQHHIDNSH